MTEMPSQNKTETNENVDVERSYFLMAGGIVLFAMPSEITSAIAILFFCVLIFMLYLWRRRLAKAEAVDAFKLSHMNLILKSFWRMSYFSILASLLSAVIVWAYGDKAALGALGNALFKGEAAGMDMANVLLNNQAVNGALMIWSGFATFLPVAAYILARLYKGYRAYKAGESIDPYAWAVK